MADIASATITFASNGGTTQGYLARPDDGASHPGVIVIQEWWGINDHIKDVARRFAGAGFVALAPDLYHGKVIDEPNEAQKAMMALDQAEVAKDLKGALLALRARNDVAPKKIGVTGFCMGGFITLTFASQAGSELGAAVSFYGGGYQPTPDAVKSIQCPVLAIYGSEDDSTPAAMRDTFQQLLKANGKTFDMVVYPGAQHAFFNDTRPQVHDPIASADAWHRTVDWLARYLR